MGLFSNRSQKTPKCGKNTSDKLSCTFWTCFLFSTHFDAICDLLLTRQMVTLVNNKTIKWLVMVMSVLQNLPSNLLQYHTILHIVWTKRKKYSYHGDINTCWWKDELEFSVTYSSKPSVIKIFTCVLSGCIQFKTTVVPVTHPSIVIRHRRKVVFKLFLPFWSWFHLENFHKFIWKMYTYTCFNKPDTNMGKKHPQPLFVQDNKTTLQFNIWQKSFMTLQNLV